jgi:signal transduction histidine kinase
LKNGASALSQSRKKRVLLSLRKVVHNLNVVGSKELKKLLDRLRVLEVDEALLNSIWERICTEPSFASVDLGPLQTRMDTDSCPLLIPRQALEDILGNLIRNAIQSSVEDGALPIAIEIKVANEVDETTGIEQMSFQVRDRSSKALDAEMLRGRYIEQGLGLAAELVAKYDGSLDVMPSEDGWSKAVVVRLPRAAAGDPKEAT